MAGSSAILAVSDSYGVIECHLAFGVNSVRVDLQCGLFEARCLELAGYLVDGAVRRGIDRHAVHPCTLALGLGRFEQIHQVCLCCCVDAFVGPIPAVAEKSALGLCCGHAFYFGLNMVECLVCVALVSDQDARLGSVPSCVWGLHHAERDDVFLGRVCFD